MFKLKYLLILSFIFFGSSSYAQEICDNGIDDDNDNLIDINDSDCQCLGSVPFEIIFGDICRDNLRLIVDDSDALSIQWFHNGVAIIGEVYDRINLQSSIPDVEGTYTAMITTTDGCYLSEPYEVIINFYEVDLGVEVICQGESIQFGNFEISTKGFFQNNKPSAIDGCDSITSLLVVVEQPEFHYDTISICQGETYDWDGMLLTEEGDFETSYPAVGCDSVVFLTLSYIDNIQADIAATICEGDVYALHDLTADMAGQYQALYTNPTGCDTLYNVDLTVLESSEFFIQETICYGDTLRFLDIEESTAGLYNSTLTNNVGCDSIITVELIVLENKINNIAASICEGQVYNLLDISESTAGTYSTTIPAYNGCDSLITVELSVGQEVSVQLEANICEGDSYSIYDITADQSGVFETRVLSGGACDTLVSLTLTVSEATTYYSNEVICEGDIFELEGISATVSGSYEDVLTNANGCDSLILIDLSVIPISNTTIQEQICEGDTYTQYDINTDIAGIYETALSNINGCDSVVTIELEVEMMPRSTVFKTICEGEEFSYRDLVINESGLYETRFSNSNGCDSIVTVELTVNQPADGISLGEDMTINLGQTIDIVPEFIGQGITELVWLDENGDFVSEEYQLLDLKPTKNVFYEVYAIDANGCDTYDIIFIDVEINIETYIPNVFSPKMNNEESKFTVSYNEAVLGVSSVQIFDRWGELVYNLSNDSYGYEGWDGTRNGKRLELGVYTYQIVFDILDGTQVKKAGSVTMI